MKFGEFDISTPLCLAPMEDVSDPPFRRLCREMGADVVYTEFAHCEAVVREVPSQCRKLAVSGDERPVGIQLYGSTEGAMADAAGRAEAEGPDFIDVNCGCWVKKIANR
ncbi:MAG TPA: tRNA-dihydrouridine synthase family protein, partial [Candidatus Hydrogenedentes bacterium]|nr:tRNA-dihydrouridine synthase family protein [Candidatus Hydrogenedentota bacterium]